MRIFTKNLYKHINTLDKKTKRLENDIIKIPIGGLL
jgi:hypothetical protein